MTASLRSAASTARRPGLARTLSIVAVVNLLLIALYAWSALETTTVEINVQGDRLVATLNGYELATAGLAAEGGGIVLYLAGREERRTYVAPGPPREGVFSWLQRIVTSLGEEPLGTAWQRVTVRDGSGRVLFEEYPTGASTGGWGDAGGGRWVSIDERVDDTSYVAQAVLRRGTTPAGVLVKARDAENGMLLLIRPEYRDFQWWRLDDGQWSGPLAAGFWSKPAVALLQDDLRLLLGTQQLALALMLLAAGLGWLLGRVSWAIARCPGRRGCDARGAGDGAAGKVPRRGRSLVAMLVGLLALALVGVTGYVALVLLEALPHVQDDVTYLFQARVMAMGRLWVPASPIPEAFEQEFIVSYAGRAFGKYPPGHALVLVPGVLANAAWLINPLQAGLTLVLTYLIGREIHGRGVGLLAALLLASSPFVIFMSGSMMAHPTALLFFSGFLLLFVKASVAAPRPVLAVLAGFALGFAFLSRPWTAVAMAVPFAAYAGYRAWREGSLEMRRYAPVVAGLAPMVALLLAYNYALTGSPLKSPMELWWPFDRLGFGAGVGISGAHTVPDGLWNTYRNLGELMKHLYGWPAYLTLAPALVTFLALRATRWDWLCLTGWLALVVAHVPWWADGVMYGPRYYYETVVLLALLTARGVVVLADLTRAAAISGAGPAGGAPGRLRGSRVLGAPAYLLAIALIGYNGAHYLPEQAVLHRGYNYVNGAALQAVRDREIHNAVVFVDLGEWYAWWNYGAVFPANTPTLDGDVVYARDRGAAQNQRVMALYSDRRYFRLSGTAVDELLVDELLLDQDGRR